MRIGSLCSGAGGLDMAVQAVFGGEVVWHSEIDKAASKVLAYRFPGVPNLGDITGVDWATVEPVDVLCGGFPCQDVSAAGKRAGIKAGTRSGLWSVFADAIDALRPQWVVVENVRGLLSATAQRTVADGDSLESAAGVMGNGAGGPVLRAIGAVLGDLCDLGYDAQWATVAAADVGAPHRRERVFILAADASRNGCGRGAERHLEQAGRFAASQRDDADRRVLADGRDIGCANACAAHAAGNGWDEGRPESARIVGGFDAAVSGDEPCGWCGRPTKHGLICLDCGSQTDKALLPTPNADVGRGVRSPEGIAKRVAKGDKQFSLEDAVALLPTPCAHQSGNSPEEHLRKKPGRKVVTDLAILVENGLLESGGELLPTPQASDGTGGGQHPDKREGHSRQLIDYVLLLPTPRASDPCGAESRSSEGFRPQLGEVTRTLETAWGKYEPAIRRWEAVTRPAPAPTEPNKNGNPRLSAAFSEWLMGWPDGWVTDPDIGISRNDQLRIIGNGVVSRCAEAAIRYLLAVAA